RWGEGDGGIPRWPAVDVDVDSGVHARGALLVGALDPRLLPRHLEHRGRPARRRVMSRVVDSLATGTPAAGAGVSAPLGATIAPGGVNFSVFSKNATRLELLLFDGAAAATPPPLIPPPP